MSNLLFPENLEQELYAILTNTATSKEITFTLLTDEFGNVVESDGVESVGLDLSSAYDLMNHVYKLTFLDKLTMQPATVNICGETGCCVEFGVITSLAGDGVYPATSGSCGEPCEVVPPQQTCEVVSIPLGDSFVVSINFGLANIELDPNLSNTALQQLEAFFVPNTVTLEITNTDYVITVYGADVTLDYTTAQFNTYSSVPC
jgi:hypothetical protein